MHIATTMVILLIIIIIIVITISLFTVEITANSYYDQQLKQLQIAANNMKQNYTIKSSIIKNCCDLNAFYFFTIPPGIYQMHFWCGGKWSTTSAFCDTKTADGGGQ